MVVVAAVDLAGVRARLGHFDDRRAAELAAPNDQCLFEQAALLQIGQQRADRLVALAWPAGDGSISKSSWLSQGWPVAVPDLHESHAALDQPPGDQHLPRLRAGAIHVENVLRLAADVEGVGRLHLHAVSQLERLDPGFQLRIALALGQMLAVELGQQVELPPLIGRGHVFVRRMFSISLSISVCCVSM